jgi:hypothetical protein
LQRANSAKISKKEEWWANRYVVRLLTTMSEPACLVFKISNISSGSVCVHLHSFPNGCACAWLLRILMLPGIIGDTFPYCCVAGTSLSSAWCARRKPLRCAACWGSCAPWPKTKPSSAAYDPKVSPSMPSKSAHLCHVHVSAFTLCTDTNPQTYIVAFISGREESKSAFPVLACLVAMACGAALLEAFQEMRVRRSTGIWYQLPAHHSGMHLCHVNCSLNCSC